MHDNTQDNYYIKVLTYTSWVSILQHFQFFRVRLFVEKNGNLIFIARTAPEKKLCKPECCAINCLVTCISIHRIDEIKCTRNNRENNFELSNT